MVNFKTGQNMMYRIICYIVKARLSIHIILLLGLACESQRRAQHNIFHAIAHSRRRLQKRDQTRPRQQHTKTECLADRRAKLLGGQTSQAPSPEHNRATTQQNRATTQHNYSSPNLTITASSNTPIRLRAPWPGHHLWSGQ